MAGEGVRGQRVALLDDVMTTGATLGALAQACRRAGAIEVQAWALARHLAKFVRTINWYRVVKLTSPGLVGDYHASVSGWFKEFLTHPTQRYSI